MAKKNEKRKKNSQKITYGTFYTYSIFDFKVVESDFNPDPKRDLN